jgi:hypothetical protein
MNKRLWQEYSDYLDDNEWISYADWLEKKLTIWQVFAWIAAALFAVAVVV